MFIRPWLEALTSRWMPGKRRKTQRLPLTPVQSRVESLEEKLVLSAFDLVTVIPNQGVFLSDGTVMSEAPSEVTLRFSPGQTIDPSSLGAISVVRAGLDGVFDNPGTSPLESIDDQKVSIGYIGVGDNPNEVVVRFASTLPDDKYQIRIQGTGAAALQSTSSTAVPFNNGIDKAFNFELNLGAQVEAVVPQPIIRSQLFTVTNSAALTDGETLVVTNGPYTAVFEFNTAPANVAPGHVYINRAGGDAAVATAIANAINSLGLSSNVALSASASGQTVTVMGSAFEPNVAFGKPVLNVLSSTGITDGDQMYLTLGDTTLAFEFNNTDVNTTVSLGYIPINFARSTVNLNTINAAIVAAVNNVMNNPSQTIQAALAGSSLVFSGTTGTPTLALKVANTSVFAQDHASSALAKTLVNLPNVSSLADGDTMTVTLNGATLTLEFNNTQVNNLVTPGRIRVNFNHSTVTASTLAAAIAAALNSPTNNPAQNILAQVVGNSVAFTGAFGTPAASWTTATSGVFSQNFGSLSQATDKVVVYFNQDELDAAIAQDPTYYRLIDSATGNITLPSAVTYQYNAQTGLSVAVLTFASPLSNATYNLKVGLSSESNAALADAIKVGTILTDPLLGPQSYEISEYLGDGNGTSTNSGDTDLYQFSTIAGGMVTIELQSGSTLDGVITFLDASGNVVPVLGNPGNSTGVGGTETLTVGPLGAGVFYVRVSSANSTTGTYRLRISSTEQASTSDDNSSFNSATNIGQLGTGGLTLSGLIQSQGAFVVMPDMPGGSDEPGHRDLPSGPFTGFSGPEVGHGSGTTGDPSAPTATAEITYSFPATYSGAAAGLGILPNQITPEQKDIVRQIFQIYSYQSGAQFREVASGGAMQIVVGDIRANAPQLDPDAAGGISGSPIIMNAFFHANDNTYGGGFTVTAFHEIGHNLGLGHSYDVPSVQGGGTTAGPLEPVYTGDNDLIHLLRIYPKNSSDIDLFKFNVAQAGTLTAQTVAERLSNLNLLNSVLTLYREESNGTRTLVARNDDFYSKDSGIELPVTPGTYYIGVTSVGNDNFDPSISNSGNGGRSSGSYELKLDFTPTASATGSLRDTTGRALDGDHNGLAGGEYETWFNVAPTLVVDKLAEPGGNGSLATPYKTIDSALAAATTGDIVRIVGNGGADRDASTTGDNVPYAIGRDYNLAQTPLADGASFQVPQGVTVMVDAGALIKVRGQTIDVGTSSSGIDRSHGALQVLGTPVNNVYFTSWRDDAKGSIDDGINGNAAAADWGGIVFRQDSDSSTSGVFLNQVNHATLQYGGGQVSVDGGPLRVYNVITLDTSRPTLTNNTIQNNADAAISANPDSFRADDGRIGPDIHGNFITNNSTNGLFIRIQTAFGSPAETLNVIARFDDTDITHVITQNLIINGRAGGELTESTSARLMIDPGTVVKLSGARIETAIGNSNLIAEGTSQKPIRFTSQQDDRYGAGGTFDLKNDFNTSPTPGNWSGFFIGQTSTASFDNVSINYAGGASEIAGNSDFFNPIEALQSTLRVANSSFQFNLGGAALTDRGGRGGNDNSTIFVRGAQPVLVNNVFQDNVGSVISINANSLQSVVMPDYGRSTGTADRFAQFDDNYGPLVRLNKFANSSTFTGASTLGMLVRTEELTIESVWDDTDIAHVVTGTIVSNEFHTYGGLTLRSSATASLVVKLFGSSAGFLATGDPLEIDDRIGGTVQVIGQPGFPVILTSLRDDTVSAGFKPNGFPQFDTNGDNNAGGASQGAPGDWNSLKFDQYSNDRNVATVVESEPALTQGNDVNNTIGNPQYLGNLAPNQNSGDENRRLGFEVHGFISPDSPGDVDVYSFTANAGTEVWIDTDFTSQRLDVMVELLNSAGVVLARSMNSGAEQANTAAWLSSGLAGTLAGTPGNSNLNPLVKDRTLGTDFYTTNFHDAGFRAVLPGAVGTPVTYFVRVRSQPVAGQEQAALPPGGNGLTSGSYQMQVRLKQVDEIPGSTVRFADIRYATNGIELHGLPAHSPLMGEAAEQTADNNGTGGAQYLGPLLQTDRNTLSVAGTLSSATDVDFYRFTLDYSQVQVIAGGSDGGKFFPTIFDIDWTDGLTRPDVTIAVYNSAGDLIYISRESDIADDQPAPGQGADLDDLSRGSVGRLDPYLGTVNLPAGVNGESESGGTDPNPPNPTLTTYYVAVFSNGQVPTPLSANFNTSASPENQLVRLEPVNSVRRVVEDHIGLNGYFTNGVLTGSPVQPTSGPIFNVNTTIGLSTNVRAFTLADVNLFVTSTDRMRVVDPFRGTTEILYGQYESGARTVQDVTMRSDGTLWAVRYTGNDTRNGVLVQIDAGTGAVIQSFGDGIADVDDNVDSERFQSNNAAVDALTWHQNGNGGAYDYLFYATQQADDYPDPAGLAGVSKLYRARNTGSAGWAASEFGASGIISDAAGTITTKTTGLQLLNGTLWGVSAAGQLYAISQGLPVAGDGGTNIGNPDSTDTPVATGSSPARLVSGNILDFSVYLNPGETFAGVSSAPQNVEGGRFADYLFIITSTGRILCVDPSAGSAATSRQLIFDSDNNNVADSYFLNTNVGGATGLGFSPVDFNLWHTTERRAGEAGHGINQTPDNSRTPGDEDVVVNLGQEQLDSNQGAGGASFYFGLEQYAEGVSGNYYQYQSTGQYGVLDGSVQQNLSLNPNIINNYNAPGGTAGSLVTNSFSLEGYAAGDRPTLYFNYWLQTEGANGKDANTMRDSARVYISRDNGLSWELVATNNSTPSADLTADAELPSYYSPSRTASPKSNQQVQELFETSGWRQARVDLNDYAGVAEIKLRFDFSTSGRTGTVVDPNTGLRVPSNDVSDPTFQNDRGSAFGVTQGGDDSPLKAQSNTSEGFYIDDIIVGFAGRGEMVTGAAGTGSTFTALPQDPSVQAVPQLLQGDYQLEIRRGNEYAALTVPIDNDTTISDGLVRDINDRMTNGQTVRVGTSVTDGQTVTIYDGLITRTFEFDTNSLVSGSNIAVNISGLNAITQRGQIAAALAAQINLAFAGRNTVIAKEVGAAVNSDRVDIFGAVTVSSTGTVAVDSYVRRGDDNLERQQGQFIIENNTILYAAQDGILIDDDNRFGTLPHPGAVLNTPVKNSDRLLTGIYIQNNVIARFGDNGINLTGDPNTALGAAVKPFVKIVNNTIYGADTTTQGSGVADVVFLIDNSASMGAAIDTLISRLLQFETEMQNANIDARYGLVQYPRPGTENPAQTQDLVDFTTFTQTGSALNSIDITGATENGSDAILEALNAFDPATTFNFRPNARKVLVMLTNEDDDSESGSQAQALAQLTGDNALFFAICVLTPFPAGNTQTIYGNYAATTGGSLFDLDDFLNNTGPFFNSFTVAVTGAIGAGGAQGVGINVANNAAPTIMNNVITNTAVGIQVDGSSVGSSEVEANLFQNNLQDGVRGNNALFGAETAGKALFVNAAANNFYPAPNSPLVDSSRSNFNDRANYVAVLNSVGIPQSPIIAPLYDRFGQLRVDDGDQPGPTNQPGLGQNPFQDRGAIESADFDGGVVVPVAPQDNDGSGIDLDASQTTIWVDAANPEAPFNILTQFRLQLIDAGIGIDDTTVDASDFLLVQNGTPLVEGTDYFFTYNQNTNEVIFTSVSTFTLDSRYHIVVNNEGIRDLAGNFLQNNHAAPLDPVNPDIPAPFDASLLYFTYIVTDGQNDAPANTAPDSVTMDEDTTFTFGSTNTISVADQDAFLAVDGDPNLGAEGGRIQVTVYVPDGFGSITSGSTDNLLANGGAFSGMGTQSDPFVIAGRIVDINEVLADLQYTPVADFPANAPAIVPLTIVSEDFGKFGPPSPGTTDPQTTTTVVNITVNPVNDAPTLDDLTPVTVLEDSGASTVNLAGITAGGGETQDLAVTVTSSDTNLFPSGSMVVNYTSANPAGSITLTPAANRFGTATISVQVRDAGLDGIAGNDDDLTVTKTFTMTVTPVNDAPGFDSIVNQTVLEDSGANTVNLTGITAGPFESQTLTFTAVSSDPTIVPDPTVLYTQGSTVGTLSFTPAANQNGTVTITLTVTDNGGTADAGVNTYFQTFTITVTAVNDAPTLNVISNATINEDAGTQTVNLTGISTGGSTDEAGQTLTITAVSSNQALIPDGNILVNYVSGSTGTLSYTPAANVSGTATITITVTDNGGTADNGVNVLTRSFTVTVNSLNDAPTLDAIPNPSSIPEDSGIQTINLTGITAGPPNEVSQTLSITATSDNPSLIPNPMVIYTSPNSTGTLTYTPVANASGTATITVTVTDNGGTANGGVNVFTRTFVVTVDAANDAPTLDAITSPAAILEDAGSQTVNLSGITAGPLETQAIQVTATSSNTTLIPNANITVNYTSANPTGSVTYTPAADQNGSTVITVTVRDAGLNNILGDGDDGITTRQFNVNVTAVNDAPTLNGISDITIDEDAPQQTVNLQGISAGPANEVGQALTVTAASSNQSLIPDGNISITYTSDNPTGVLTFTPLPNAHGTATITVTVTDNGGLANSGSNTFTRTFVVTVDPVADQPTDIQLSSNEIFENRPVGTVVGLLTSSDVDLPGDSFTYEIISGTGMGLFQIVGDQLQVAQLLNFEAQDSYTLRIRSTDQNNLQTEKDFTIQILDLNDAPTLDPIADQTFDEDSGAHVVNLTGITSGMGESQNLTVTATSDNPSLFPNPISVTYTPNNPTGSLTLTPAANQVGTATITVTVTDNGGTADGGLNTYTRTFTVTVLPLNDGPTDILLSNATIPEIPAGTTLPANVLVGQLTAVDPDLGDTFLYQLVSGVGSEDNFRFLIINDQLIAQGPLDFDAQPTYSIRVRTTDQSGTGESFEKVLTITATNVNEPATGISVAPNGISQVPNSIPENLPVGSLVGALIAADPDVDDTTTFTLVSGAGATDNGLFQIVNGQLFALATFNYEIQNSYSIRVRATDADGLTFESAVVISVTNVNEQPTNITLSNSTLEENTPVGTAVGDLSTTDIDVGDTFTYSLVSGAGATDNAKFSISGNQLVVAVPPNYEDNPGHFYSVRLRATDAGGLTYEKVFTITITNVDEAPTALTLSSTSINENQPAGSVVGTFNTVDQDTPESFTYSLVGGVGATDNDAFTIVNNQLRTAAAFDFETKDEYSIRVRTTDSVGLSLEQTFTITVNDTLDAPVITVADTPISTKGRKAVAVDPGATVNDIDSPNFDGGRLVVSILSGEQTGDQLSIRKDKSSGMILKAVRGKSVLRLGKQDIAMISGGVKGIPLTLQFSSGISQELMQLVMRNVTFRGKPYAAPRVITMQVFDETGLGSNVETRNINVT